MKTKRKMRWWIPITIMLLIGLVIVRAFQNEDWLRFFYAGFLPVIGLILTWNWYALCTGLPGKTKLKLFGIGFVVFMIFSSSMAGLFRWDDTYGGTSVPKPTWRFAKQNWERAAELGETVPPKAGVEFPEVEQEGNLADSLTFLGPNGDGTFENPGWELNWAEKPPKLVWKQKIGVGWSGFAVSDRFAITQEQRGETELVTCYDVPSGTQIWSHGISALFTASMGGSGPRATPTIAGDKVFVQGATGVLTCLEVSSGAEVWNVDVLGEFGLKNLEWGKSNSPLVIDEMVIVTGGESMGPMLLAYGAADGKLVWKSELGIASYSTPTILEVNGQRQLVSLNGRNLTGREIETGKLLWSWPWNNPWPHVSQPQVIEGNKILVTASYGIGSYLIDVSGPKPAEVWDSNKIKTKFSSTVIRDGYAYGLDEGILACVDLKTGKRLWKGGRYGFGQNILLGDKILVQSEKGFLALVKAIPEDFEEIAQVDAIESTTWNVPTIAGDYLLVRNAEEAACFLLE